MPKITDSRYAPNDPKWWKLIGDVGDKERKAREQDIDRGWAYYEGEQPEPLKVRPGDPNYNVILDFCGQAIDAMVAFLGIPRLEVLGGVERAPNEAGLLSTIKSPEQLKLELLWEVNDLKLALPDILKSGYIAGHTFLKLIESAPVTLIEPLDPRFVTVYYANHKTPIFYRTKWSEEEQTLIAPSSARIQDIVPGWMYRGEEQPEGGTLDWVIVEYIDRGVTHEVTGEDRWAHPYPPIVEWKNASKPFEYYGRPDLTKIKRRKNDAANLVASNTQKIIFHHGGPQTVLTGGKLSADQNSGPGTVIEIENNEAKLYNLEMESDLVSSMEFLNMLRGAFFESARVVDRASVKDKLGDLTNFAVRMLYGSQLDAGYEKQTYYGRGITLASQRALDVMGVPVAKVVDHWDEMLPQDRTAVVASVAVEKDLGIVSDQTLLGELGHDPVEEAEQRAEETTNQQEQVGNLLTRLGERGAIR